MRSGLYSKGIQSLPPRIVVCRVAPVGGGFAYGRRDRPIDARSNHDSAEDASAGLVATDVIVDQRRLSLAFASLHSEAGGESQVVDQFLQLRFLHQAALEGPHRVEAQLHRSTQVGADRFHPVDIDRLQRRPREVNVGQNCIEEIDIVECAVDEGNAIELRHTKVRVAEDAAFEDDIADDGSGTVGTDEFCPIEATPPHFRKSQAAQVAVVERRSPSLDHHLPIGDKRGTSNYRVSKNQLIATGEIKLAAGRHVTYLGEASVALDSPGPWLSISRRRNAWRGRKRLRYVDPSHTANVPVSTPCRGGEYEFGAQVRSHPRYAT